MASFCSSTEIRNFQCVTVASVDLIKLPLRDILDSHIKPVDLYHKIKSCSTLKLRPDQLKICLIPPPGVPDYKTFDVTLLYTLIRNLCSLPCPAQGWGNEPKTKDAQISDDIERLRLFRNNYYAHAQSALISNAKFEDVWKNLKLILKRIQPKTACSIDYEEQLIHIERTKFTDEYLTTFRVLLEALVTLEKQTDDKDEANVSIRGENEIIWGDTAHFEADVKKADSSCWSLTWHRRRGDDIKCIDTSVEKYRGSTKRTLVINSVCKEDEGEYQALLSFESKGPDYKSRNTIRLHVIGDVPNVRIFLDSPIHFGSDTIIKSVVSPTPTPEKTEWQKSKDGTNFHLIGQPNIYLDSTENFKTPFLVIPKTTFADRLYYRLWVWNKFGKSPSNTLYLNVTGSPPNITTSFVTNIKNRSVKLMGEVYFFDHSPGILKTFWTKNGEKIDIEESNGKLSETRFDNPSLTITNVGPDDAGEYKVTAINAVGSTTSEVIVLGIPSVFSERVEDEKNGGWRITVTITSFPAPCKIRWNAKSKDDDTFTPIDISAEEYDGTTVTFPHSVLVVRQRDQLEKNCYQIEITNFIGKIVQTISGNNKPTVTNKDIVQNTFYKDRGARVRFTKLSNILAQEFPPHKLEILQFTLTNSNIVQNRTSVMEATSALQCIRILQDEELFTQMDVIVMQFLCTQTGCLDLHAKCVEYAEQQKALCYFEKPSVDGYKNAQFHVKGELSSYSKDYIQDVLETVAAILDCKEEDILLNGVRHSKSFLLSLSVKKVYMKKLLALSEQDRLRLVRLNIDYLIIDKETINLERPKGETCDKNPVVLKNTAAYLDLRTTQSLRQRSPSVGVPLRNKVDRHHAALYRTSLPHASLLVAPRYGMADDEGTDVDITHDVFLIHANEPKEDKVFALLKLKPLLESQNLKVLVDEEDFLGGETVFTNITRAVRRCRKSLIVLTKHSRESPWCSLELLLALEKSHRRSFMSVVVLRKGNSSEHQLVLDMLNYVPHVDIQNDDDIKGKLDELVSIIKERKKTEELLPAGNIAHAQVWSHYFGLLQYLLPVLEALVERTEIFKKYPTRFSTKLYELVPENCKCPRVIEDIPISEQRIAVMAEKLPNLCYTRSGNKRDIQMTIYCVRDTDGTDYYCVAEYPAVIAGIQKMIEETSSTLLECDRRTQIGRFYYTLSALLQHESLEGTLNKANIIMYNENRSGFVLADVLVKAIKEDLHVGSIKEGRIELPLDRLSLKDPAEFVHDAFLFYDDESQEIKTEIYKYLKEKDTKLYIEDERAGKGANLDLNYVSKNCYWTVVILTRKTLKNEIFSRQLFSLLQDMIMEKKIRLIPVLVDTRYGDIPDAIRVAPFVHVGVEGNKRYLERLYCTIKGKEIPFDRDTLIPAGNIAYGLAWTYVLNYLTFVLKGLGDSIIRALEQHNKSSSIYKEKVYILVPFSCDCKAKLSDADDSISYLDTIHPVYVDHSGNSRKYSFDMYNFFDKDKEYVFVGQYAAAITCLDDICRVGIAGLSEDDKIRQARIFCHEIQYVLDKRLIEYTHFCEVVSYDDTSRKCSLSAEMKKRLKQTN